MLTFWCNQQVSLLSKKYESVEIYVVKDYWKAIYKGLMYCKVVLDLCTNKSQC